jgi:thiol-disulfide isomerase/thioredoxin
VIALGRARIAGWALVLAVAAVIVVDLTVVGRGCQLLRPPHTGAPALDFALPTIDGEGEVAEDWTSLESLRGKVVLIDFWATWCHPCRVSMPVLASAVARHELAPGAALVADEGDVADSYGVSTLPHLVLVDRSGRVVLVERRVSSPEVLRRTIDEALGRALTAE